MTCLANWIAVFFNPQITMFTALITNLVSFVKKSFLTFNCKHHYFIEKLLLTLKRQRESRQTSQQRNQPELNLNAQDKRINYANISDMITSAKNEIIFHIDQSVEKIQNSINAATIAREPNVNAIRDTLIANMSKNNWFKEFRIKQLKRLNGEYAPDKVKALFKQELEGKYSMEYAISVLYKEFDD
jgi:hypothetical protein